MIRMSFRFYLLGYSQSLLSRGARRMLAGKPWHRAWLLGFIGSYKEHGQKQGVLDRQWFAYRKGSHCPAPVRAKVLIAHLLFPFS